MSWVLIIILNLMLGSAFAVSVLQAVQTGDTEELVVCTGFAAAVFVLDFLFGQHLASLKDKAESPK